MRATWAKVAELQRRLAGCVLAMVLVPSFGGVPLLAVPAAIVAAHTLLQLSPRLDRPAAQLSMQWAAVASGGVAAAGALGFPSSSRDAAAVVFYLAVSVTFSLYALGLAAWTAPVGDGRPALRLRVSVGLWWVNLLMIALAHDRDVAAPAVALASLPGLVAGLLLIHTHLLIRVTMEELAGEAEPARA